MHPQVAGRPFGLLLGHATTNAFIDRPSYAALAELPYEEKVERLREPKREEILSEEVARRDPIAEFVRNSYHKMYVLGDPPDYEPGPELTVQAIANREARTPDEVLYDLLLEDDGTNMLMFPLLNYSYGSCEALREMLLHPRPRSAGRRRRPCGLICDASIPTFMLSHWVRDRTRGDKLPLEWVVKKQTHDTAELFGLGDRAPWSRARRPTSTWWTRAGCGFSGPRPHGTFLRAASGSSSEPRATSPRWSPEWSPNATARTPAPARDGSSAAPADVGPATVRNLTRSQVERRQRVIDAAMNLAADGGYEAVQMRDVASTAGVALGTIYRYFASKDHLLAAAMVEWAVDLEARGADQPSNGTTPPTGWSTSSARSRGHGARPGSPRR